MNKFCTLLLFVAQQKCITQCYVHYKHPEFLNINVALKQLNKIIFIGKDLQKLQIRKVLEKINLND